MTATEKLERLHGSVCDCNKTTLFHIESAFFHSHTDNSGTWSVIMRILFGFSTFHMITSRISHKSWVRKLSSIA
jgi:hypothetical protein